MSTIWTWKVRAVSFCFSWWTDDCMIFAFCSVFSTLLLHCLLNISITLFHSITQQHTLNILIICFTLSNTSFSYSSIWILSAVLLRLENNKRPTFISHPNIASRGDLRSPSWWDLFFIKPSDHSLYPFCCIQVTSMFWMSWFALSTLPWLSSSAIVMRSNRFRQWYDKEVFVFSCLGILLHLMCPVTFH